MTLLEVLRKIDGKPIGTAYKTGGSYVKVVDKNTYEISIFGGATIVVRSDIGFSAMFDTDWEKDVKTFDFAKAIALAKEGKFVTRKAWPISQAIGNCAGTIKFYAASNLLGDVRYNHREPYNPTQTDMFATDWCYHKERIE